MKLQLLLAFLLFTQWAVSQDSLQYYPSISLHVGELFSAQRDFEKTYDSKQGFVFGGGIEFPLIKKFSLVGTMTYFFKTGSDFEWRQWIINGGARYRAGITENFALTLCGGMAFTIFLETTPVMTVIGRTSGNMNPGFFGGIGADYFLSSFPVTVFFEADFSYLGWTFPTYTHNYGGTAVSIGARYHFVR